MMRWLLGMVALFLVVFFAIGSPPVRAGTAVSSTFGCDEHPWDKIRNAFRVQFLVITPEYVLVAVWYNREQIYPVIMRIDITSLHQNVRLKNTFIFTD